MYPSTLRDDHLLNFNAGKAPVRDAVSFTLNGKPITVQQPDPKLLLADYLRDIGLTGTKIGCSEGGCGACTVLLDGDSHGSRYGWERAGWAWHRKTVVLWTVLWDELSVLCWLCMVEFWL
ncbi:hypothetical protein SARC_00621 [Sphaeroforma arctica JP610]|uniref:2Fe-2S ferredoxin-type domain-containing protein n=1 Tax=Sphaeroforma arctica JP610 TaxID=667725 RepID=A0A0L0GDZ6_9EUKA|nr:hypothetical protein SARC_00621 [Sphaeroforma arctica JP610]KNC87235.1 hypothetical protein SARC_00621 [Sphaeroforma arctica JP610]|eukprot:XP_014161137.1 hypothetical protein SARC_00621 [Sphaeroforma arctica JP610]